MKPAAKGNPIHMCSRKFTRRIGWQCIAGGNRPLKLLVVYVVVASVYYASTLQFKSAFSALESAPGSVKYGQVEFEPSGARRWESGGNEDRSLFNNVNNAHQQQQNSDREDTHDIHQEAPTPEQLSPSLRVPRSIALENSIDLFSVTVVNGALIAPDLKEDSMPVDGPQIQPNWYDANAIDFVWGYDKKICEPMYDWQLASYPNCNSFHELDTPHMRMINKGGSRIAFEMIQHLDGEEKKFVYKTVKYSKDITDSLVEEQRKDSIVLERTSSSQFIPDIHGYCSLGVMMDFMPEGNMHDYIKGARRAGGSTLPPVDRLRLSIHIASSVADLHTIDGTKQPSIFHNDICCHQYLFQDGVFKLNDFNYAFPIYKHKTTHEICKRKPSRMKIWKGRSLEEHIMKNLKHSDFEPMDPDAIDVWMMGNLIYYMLTDLYTFEKPKNLNIKETGKELVAGRRSPYPQHIQNSTDPSHTAIKEALSMCWTQRWQERPPARKISDYLIGKLKEITGQDNPDFRVVLPKRNPKQKGTDSEYYAKGWI